MECLRLWWMCIGELLGFFQSKRNYSAALTYSSFSVCLHLTGVQSVTRENVGCLGMLVLRSTQQLVEVSIKIWENMDHLNVFFLSHAAVTVVFSHSGNWDGMHTGKIMVRVKVKLMTAKSVIHSPIYKWLHNSSFLVSGHVISMADLSLSISERMVIFLSFEYGLCKIELCAFDAFLYSYAEEEKGWGIRN